MLELVDEGEHELALTVFLKDAAGLTPEEVEASRTHPMWPEYVVAFVETVLPKLEAEAEADYQFDSDRFAELTVPTLLLAGNETAEWLLEATNAVANALPNSRIATVDDHGHGASSLHRTGSRVRSARSCVTRAEYVAIEYSLLRTPPQHTIDRRSKLIDASAPTMCFDVLVVRILRSRGRISRSYHVPRAVRSSL